MAVEAAYSSMLQIDLTCDLGLIYDVPFNAEDFGEIATLFGLALEVDVYSKQEQKLEDEADAPRGLTARLIHLEEGEIASRIGKKLLEDAVVRNVVPILNVPISARWNFVATGKLGAKVKKYMRYRHAIRAAVRDLQLGSIVDPEVLVKGAWLLATVDGDAGHEEMLALSAVMDLLSPEQREAIAANHRGGRCDFLHFRIFNQDVVIFRNFISLGDLRTLHHPVAGGAEKLLADA